MPAPGSRARRQAVRWQQQEQRGVAAAGSSRAAARRTWAKGRQQERVERQVCEAAVQQQAAAEPPALALRQHRMRLQRERHRQLLCRIGALQHGQPGAGCIHAQLRRQQQVAEVRLHLHTHVPTAGW